MTEKGILKNLNYKMIVLLLGLIILASNFIYILNLETYYRVELKDASNTWDSVLRNEKEVKLKCNINFNYKYYLSGHNKRRLEIQAKNQPEAYKNYNNMLECLLINFTQH